MTIHNKLKLLTSSAIRLIKDEGGFFDLTAMIGFMQCTQAATFIIQSIQTGEIVIAANTSSNTATITQVSTQFSAVVFAGWYSPDTTSPYNPAQTEVRLTLTNSTTVTAVTNTTNVSNARTVRYTIIEFSPPAIKKIQTGTIAKAANSATATISAVNTANTVLTYGGMSCTRTSNNWVNNPRLTLTDSTTVTASSSSTSGTDTITYTAIEFNDNIVQSIQYVNTTVAAASATGNTTITAVTDANAICFWLGFTMSLFSDSWNSDHPHIQRTSTTNVRATRGAANSTQLDTTCVVVEFKTAYVSAHSTGTTTIATSNTTNTAAIVGTDTNKMIVTWLGWLGATFADADTLPFSWQAIAMTNTTTVTLTRATSSATLTTTGGWEFIQLV